MACPNCKDDHPAERGRFKTATSPIERGASATVLVDLLTCQKCGMDYPQIRGKKRYVLVLSGKLSSLMADLDGARQTNSEMSSRLEAMERRAQTLAAEVESVRVEGEIATMRSKVEAIESETKRLELRRAKLREAIETIAAGMRIPPKAESLPERDLEDEPRVLLADAAPDLP